MKIAVVGATGLVGSIMLAELASGDFDIPVDEVIPLASGKSAGREIYWKDERIPVRILREDEIPEVDIALFSAGADVARRFAPLFAEKGAFVIDNSSAFRREPSVPLVVPEINADTITADTKIIANPNCSTIQLVMVLAPLRSLGIKSVFVSTYQAISGAGAQALIQFLEEWEDMWDYIEGKSPTDLVGRHPYADMDPPPFFTNLVPAIGSPSAAGEYTEESKVRFETRKILSWDDRVHIAVVAVRVPVINAHSEAVLIEFEKSPCIADIIFKLEKFPGVKFSARFPTPVAVSGRREVFVGRLRHDPENSNFVHMWIVADNLRKGAATNAVQIAEFVAKKFLS